MDVAVFCLVLIGLAAFVAAPLYRPTSSNGGGTGRAPSATRRSAISAALVDLEVDRASGLLDEAAYATEKAALEAEAAALSDASAD